MVQGTIKNLLNRGCAASRRSYQPAPPHRGGEAADEKERPGAA